MSDLQELQMVATINKGLACHGLVLSVTTKDETWYTQISVIHVHTCIIQFGTYK